MKLSHLGLVVIALSLVGCGSDNATNSETFIPVSQVPALNHSSVKTEKLKIATQWQFERHVKQGIYLRSQNEYQNLYFGQPEAVDASSEYSTTNVQENGVDESDRVKFDGEHLFIVNEEVPSMIAADVLVHTYSDVRVMHRANDGQMEEVGRIEVPFEQQKINELYLTGSMLAVLASDSSIGLLECFAADCFWPQEQSFSVALFDVNNGSDSTEKVAWQFDGQLIDSRRIDNKIYLVSRYTPQLDGTQYEEKQQEQVNKYNRIMQTSISDIMPKYRDHTGQEQAMVNNNNCLLPVSTQTNDGFDGMVNITVLDIENPTQVDSICINSDIQGIYSAKNALYLYSTRYEFADEQETEQSIIHKFSLNDSLPSYQASGLVDGRFNWHMSNLRFSEHNDDLRVVTTSGHRGPGFNHKLFTLRQENDELRVISQLPNDTFPTLIGKVDENGLVQEDIEAVRYFGERAFIVTFLRIDPLYVIDLSDPFTPNIAGALDVPGYSAYLHPINENLLLGIGQQVNAGQVGGNVNPTIQGAKVSLFDISDSEFPRELNTLVFADAYTPAEYDYRALSVLETSDGTTRFAMPIERWLSESVQDDNDEYTRWFSENSLAMFEVNLNGISPNLLDKGLILAEKDEPNNWSGGGWYDRSLIVSDSIYYIHQGRVWQGIWGQSGSGSGPY